VRREAEEACHSLGRERRYLFTKAVKGSIPCAAKTSSNPLDSLWGLPIFIARVPLKIRGYPAKFSGFARFSPFKGKVTQTASGLTKEP